VQWVVPVSSDPAIHAMAAAHAKFMSDVMGLERRCFLGTAVATADATAIAAAKDLNSDRCSLVHLGIYDYNTAGVLTLYPPYIASAIIAGAFAGVNPGTPMTNKALSIKGIERRLRNPVDTDELLKGGVMPLEIRPTGYYIVQSITTWLTNANYNRREVSCGFATDYTARAVRQALAAMVGRKGSPLTLTEAIVRTAPPTPSSASRAAASTSAGAA